MVPRRVASKWATSGSTGNCRCLFEAGLRKRFFVSFRVGGARVAWGFSFDSAHRRDGFGGRAWARPLPAGRSGPREREPPTRRRRGIALREEFAGDRRNRRSSPSRFIISICRLTVGRKDGGHRNPCDTFRSRSTIPGGSYGIYPTSAQKTAECTLCIRRAGRWGIGISGNWAFRPSMPPTDHKRCSRCKAASRRCPGSSQGGAC